jgi:hypothetical protein
MGSPKLSLIESIVKRVVAKETRIWVLIPAGFSWISRSIPIILPRAKERKILKRSTRERIYISYYSAKEIDLGASVYFSWDKVLSWSKYSCKMIAAEAASSALFLFFLPLPERSNLS